MKSLGDFTTKIWAKDEGLGMEPSAKDIIIKFIYLQGKHSDASGSETSIF